MPIYEYICNDCGHEFDTLQKMSADPLVDCPVCAKSALKKENFGPEIQTEWFGAGTKPIHSNPIIKRICLKAIVLKRKLLTSRTR